MLCSDSGYTLAEASSCLSLPGDGANLQMWAMCVLKMSLLSPQIIWLLYSEDTDKNYSKY